MALLMERRVLRSRLRPGVRLRLRQRWRPRVRPLSIAGRALALLMVCAAPVKAEPLDHATDHATDHTPNQSQPYAWQSASEHRARGYHWADERALSFSLGIGSATGLDAADAHTDLALELRLGMRLPLPDLAGKPLVAHPALGYDYAHRDAAEHQLSVGGALLWHLDPLLGLGLLSEGVATLESPSVYSLRNGLRAELLTGVFAVDVSYQLALSASGSDELRILFATDLIRAVPVMRAGWTAADWLFRIFSR